MKNRKTYSELMRIDSFEDRFEYLKLDGSVGLETFGFDRYLNQRFYTSPEWRRFRREIILRDDGCDLGCYDRPIRGNVLIHHINPITLKDINDRSNLLMDPENVISVSFDTHNAIHYGDISLIQNEMVERRSGDTCLW